MGAPSDQFLRIEYGGPLRSVSSLIMEASLCPFFILYGGPQIIFCTLYWGPQITFFVYYMGPLISVSFHTISVPLSDQFHCLLYAPPPFRSVSLHVIGGGGGHLRFYFFLKIYGGHLRSVSPLTICGPSQVSFFAYYMGPLQVSFFSYYIGAPLRSVSSLTVWGPLSDQFLRILYWGPPQFSFFAYYRGAP